MNNLCITVLCHKLETLPEKPYMDWNNASDSAFAEWKKAYNEEYYQTHKDQWKIYNDPELKSELENKVQQGVSNMANQALDTATTAATNYLETHKEEIAKQAVDKLEIVAASAMSVGKEILSEMKRRAQDSWNVGVDTIINKAKKAKNDFQSSFNSGMDSIVSGIKSFTSLWKSGW